MIGVDNLLAKRLYVMNIKPSANIRSARICLKWILIRILNCLEPEVYKATFYHFLQSHSRQINISKGPLCPFNVFQSDRRPHLRLYGRLYKGYLLESVETEFGIRLINHLSINSMAHNQRLLQMNHRLGDKTSTLRANRHGLSLPIW